MPNGILTVKYTYTEDDKGKVTVDKSEVVDFMYTTKDTNAQD